MNKLIITIVLGLIAATVVGYFYFSNLDMSQQGADEMVTTRDGETATPSSEDVMKGKDSIMSLFKLGKSMECTFVFSADGMRGEGTGYFDKDRSRVDSLYTGVGEAPVASYMITDGPAKTMYMWSLVDGKMAGMKMAIQEATEETTEETTEAPVPPQTRGGDAPQVNPDTEVTYDCKSWSADNSVFVPPTDVEFTDMSEMQNMMKNMPMNMETMQIPGR